MEDERVRNVWKGYFENLLNEENPNEFEEEPLVEGPIEDIDVEEIRAAIESMKPRKVAGPSGVTTDLIKSAGDSAVRELHQIIREIFQLQYIMEMAIHYNVVRTEDCGCLSMD